MIVLDTSVLVDALCGDMDSEPAVRSAVTRGEQLILPSLVLYEWLRGPRQPRELDAQESLLPSDRALPFGPDEASEAAHIYSTVGRARGREVDLAIAACAITWNAELWTLNLADFEDIPGLRVSLPG
ncbi:MAG: type II toxin-antitoxin system VapC family toxin [marine benthic group bacterium]|nr:type II toxin-antitoxin system VapC family toxin [Gemmatimonadota bacterium]